MNTLSLEFDQPVIWAPSLIDQFYLDGIGGKVASGSIAENNIALRLKEPSAAKTIAYLNEMRWTQDKLIVGANGIAALTFCDVPILSSRPSP